MGGVRLIELAEEIHADNAEAARKLRERLAARRVFLLNVMSAPGSGKTSTILATLAELRRHYRCAVLEADIDSTVDADAIAATGIPAVQLRTGGFCHLDAVMVERGLDALELDGLDVVIVENVGNLVCPAEFDTGAHASVMILSVPEGDDKPLKYPLMFTVSDALLVNKIDYLALADFDRAALRTRVLALNPRIEIFEMSAKTGAGVASWTGWLCRRIEAFRGP